MCLPFEHSAREETREVCKKEGVFSHSHNNSRVSTYAKKGENIMGSDDDDDKGPMNIDQGRTWIEEFGEI